VAAAHDNSPLVAPFAQCPTLHFFPGPKSLKLAIGFRFPEAGIPGKQFHIM
jgi:hypothetical protein